MAPPMADAHEMLRRYLADHDAPCPACGYNLRGLEGETCPECGEAVALRAYPDAERLDDVARTALYLKYHDVTCRHCKASLGGTDGTCPGCGRQYVVRGLPRLEPVSPAGAGRGHLVRVVLRVLLPALVAVGLVGVATAAVAWLL